MLHNKKRIRDYGVIIGDLPTGKLNSITDVNGVKVGHVTLNNGPIKTGVTAIIPTSENIYKNKLLVGHTVLNGYGKSTGLVQIEELGTLETPIILTNTLSVGDAYRGLVKYMLDQNPDICVTTGSVNPLICECNDFFLNDIRGLHVKSEHVLEALEGAKETFEEGAVGAGTGMSAFQLKGGIGTSSRMITIRNKSYTVGALVLTNMGLLQQLTINGKKVGSDIKKAISDYKPQTDKGSIIMIIATDAPLSSRQLKRISKRTVAGLSRTGPNISHTSGEIAIGFSTANIVPHYCEDTLKLEFIADDDINPLFDAVADSTEEAVLNSMITADEVVGRDNHKRDTLKRFL